MKLLNILQIFNNEKSSKQNFVVSRKAEIRHKCQCVWCCWVSINEIKLNFEPLNLRPWAIIFKTLKTDLKNSRKSIWHLANLLRMSRFTKLGAESNTEDVFLVRLKHAGYKQRRSFMRIFPYTSSLAGNESLVIRGRYAQQYWIRRYTLPGTSAVLANFSAVRKQTNLQVKRPLITSSVPPVFSKGWGWRM
jgi:hypothetical protein